jgi:hypothetical protein
MEQNRRMTIRRYDNKIQMYQGGWPAPPCGVYTINWMRLLISQEN